jgi:Raf kinase inhibitor-like YbhB/YbcL family protein
MKLMSPEFADGGIIPDQYTLNGNNRVPPLQIEEVPHEALSLVLILEDPETPHGTLTHWLLVNVDPQIRDLNEHFFLGDIIQGKNDFGKVAYCGPSLVPARHTYLFKVYALDWILSLQEGVDREELEDAMQDHVLASATLMVR